jgi:hypothetical protein
MQILSFISITDLGWIANLLNNVVNFIDCQLDNVLVHPRCLLKRLGKLIFNVRNNRITEFLGFRRKGFLDEEATKNPSKAVIDMVDTNSPSFWC